MKINNPHISNSEILEATKQFDRVINERVVFTSEDLHKPSASMMASEFHLPFPSMHILLKTPYNFKGDKLSSFTIVDVFGMGFQKMFGTNFRYRFISNDTTEGIEFNILDTGEIVIKSMNHGNMSMEDILMMTPEVVKDITKLKHEAPYYNFIYEVTSLIDYINNTPFMVTKHSTDKQTGKRLGNGIIQRRIKLKTAKEKRPNYQGTGLGTKHRYKYRVRGHWREYDDGKKTWIKDHVRGGDGTIFIPKEYDVK